MSFTNRITRHTALSLIFVLITFATTSAQTRQPQQSPPPGGIALRKVEIDTEFNEHFVDVNGRKLHAKVYGAGAPTIVLISGNMSPMWNWHPIIPELAEIATVVTYDRPGIGKSEMGDAPNHARRAVDDLNALLNQLDPPTPYVIVGHSYGCRVGRLYAAYYPEHVAAILLEDGAHPRILEAQREVLEGEDLAQLEAMVSQMSQVENPRAEHEYSMISLQQALECPPLPEVPYTVLTAGDRAGAMPPIFSDEGRQKLIELGMELQRDLAALVPGGKHIVVENSGHVIHRDRTEVAVDEITALVEQVKARE